MIDAEKLDRAILAQLRRMNGSWDVNIAEWQRYFLKSLGTWAEHAEVISAMKRLLADGLINLKKHSKEYPSEYTGPECDWWFFGYYTFEVSISDGGRLFWNVSTAPIGFQVPA